MKLRLPSLRRLFRARLPELRRLFRRPSVSLICVREEDTWTWPEHLGEKTLGRCGQCNALIYYEKQNAHIKDKVCSRCAWNLPASQARRG